MLPIRSKMALMTWIGLVARIHPLRACGILECCPAHGCQEMPVRGGISVGGCDFLWMQRGPALRRDLEEPTKKNGGPCDPPSMMKYRLVMKVQVPLARQRP